MLCMRYVRHTHSDLSDVKPLLYLHATMPGVFRLPDSVGVYGEQESTSTTASLECTDRLELQTS